MVANLYNKVGVELHSNDFILITLTFVFFGIVGIIILRRNLIIVLMAIELIFLATSLNFVFFGTIYEDLIGQIAALILLTIAAAETSIALAVIVSYYRIMHSTEEYLYEKI